MKFLNIDEIKVGKFQSIIDDISTVDNNIINDIELESIDEVVSYLHNRYDTDLIFSQTGNNRSPIIKKIVRIFMLCALFSRVNSNEIPESLIESCDKYTKWLTDVSKGIISPNLPQKDPLLEQTSLFQGSSYSRFNNTDSLS